MEHKLIDFPSFLKWNHLKQQEVAKAIGISTSMMSAIATGKARMSRSHIDRLERFADIHRWDLGPLRPYYTALNKVLEHLNAGGFSFPLICGPNSGGVYTVETTIYEKIKYAEIVTPDSVIREILDLKKGINPLFLSLDDPSMLTYDPDYYSCDEDEDEDEESATSLLKEILRVQTQILDSLNRICEQNVSK